MNDEDKKLREEKLTSQKVYDGNLLQVYRDTVSLPNDNESSREYICHVGAVAIVPMLPDGKVIVERQFRYPLDKVITEIPAGKLDGKSEDRLEAAKRELREETGYTADEWIDIGDYYPAAAYSDERITMYLAKGLHKGQQELDEDEFLNIVAVDLHELVEQIMKGEIADGKTMAALLKAARLSDQ